MTGAEIRRYADSIRAYGFGGLVGLGLGIILSYRFNVSLGLPPRWFIAACGLLGTICHQTIQGFLNLVFGPIFKLLAFHEKLYELDALARRHVISAEKHRELVDKLVEKRFLE
jgi:hypothetical protein